MAYNRIEVKSAKPPTVEIDTAALAVYVRFKKTKVVKTLDRNTPGAVVTIDLDAAGDVVGIELIGVREFSIGALLKTAKVEAPNSNLDKARYMSTRAAFVEPEYA